ncbi:unnamed protein product [Paramecium octaurelia]|uniref:Uncharacterized protein n=1 Tax=Paramecium octaurelia TaxID=43137 RepID=A0A8S1U9W0_PAROT|nr:unnamed protein product [Paramecium octaurelia]
MLSSNNRYKDNPSTIQYYILPEALSHTIILKISYNSNLEAQGA